MLEGWPEDKEAYASAIFALCEGPDKDLTWHGKILDGRSHAIVTLRRGKVPSIEVIQGNFAKFDPRLFIYVRPAGGVENYLC